MDLDITTISTIAVAIGALIGIVLAVEQLRHIAKQREADFLINFIKELHENGNCLLFVSPFKRLGAK